MELIYDFETLSDESYNCAVIDAAWLLFDRSVFTQEGYTFDQLIREAHHVKLDIKEQVRKHGFKIKESTLDFWREQDKKVREKIFPSENDVSVEEFCKKFFTSIRGQFITRHWSRGNSFDGPILERLSKAGGYFSEMPPYNKIRDTRTAIDAARGYAKGDNSFIPIKNEELWKEKFQAHNSIHDIVADVLRLQAIERINEGLDLPE